MKYMRLLVLFSLIFSLFAGCGGAETAAPEGDLVLATTYPVYYLTDRLFEGVEEVSVDVLVQDQVSCLHDYTLTTAQMKKIEQAEFLVMNGGHLEHFMESALEGVPSEKIITAKVDENHLIPGEDGEEDPHYWLNPNLYTQMLDSIYTDLVKSYPQHEAALTANKALLISELLELSFDTTALSCRDMITFHDGFSYFAVACDVTIAAAIEEEEGAEASAQQIEAICDLIREKNIPAIFVEKNGSTNAADIIAAETGVKVYVLDTVMDGEKDYITAMKENFRVVKEALS